MHRTVVLLGLVSLLTDVSTESVNAVLPNYLLVVVGLSPQAFGVVNGLYAGVSALVRLVAGWAADRTDRPKWIAALGYATSAVSKFALLVASSFGAFSAIATVDQLGKGVRTAPRDAMIAASAAPEALGRAFGVHRALDTFGAFVGPLLAFTLLTVVPGDYHSVFVVSCAFAVMGVATLLLVVPDIRRRARTVPAVAVDPGRPVGRVSLRLLGTRRMGAVVTAAGLLGLLSVGDAYVFLELQHRFDLALRYFPLLVVGLNLAYLVLAVPVGRLADRVGRARVFLAGHVALVGAYWLAGGPLHGDAALVGCLVLLGAHYAATDGVLAAMTAPLVEPAVRASAIATAQTVVAATAFVSSLGFAELWSLTSRADALVTVAVLLVLALPVAAVLLRQATRTEPAPARASAADGGSA